MYCKLQSKLCNNCLMIIVITYISHCKFISIEYYCVFFFKSYATSIHNNFIIQLHDIFNTCCNSQLCVMCMSNNH